MTQPVRSTRFRNESIMSEQTFSSHFLNNSIKVIQELSCEDIESVVDVLRKTQLTGGRLFLAGSGGGAGHASHATCDFRKLCGIQAYCITDNVSELTARVNDDGWDTSYRDWLLASQIGEHDCLLVFSVGGGSYDPPVSINLVKAIELAKERRSSVVGVVGRDGGVLRRLADASVCVPVFNSNQVTPQTEGLQALIWHLMVSHPKLSSSTAKWEGLDQQ
jgi:D-sedoheptulose 7-phosphate isomerase